MEQIPGGNEFSNPSNAIGKSVAIGVVRPSIKRNGMRACVDCGGCCGKGLHHGRHGVGVGPFDPELLALEIETNNWVMPGDPEAWHGIGTPNIAWFRPGGGFITQPSGPVTIVELS